MLTLLLTLVFAKNDPIIYNYLKMLQAWITGIHLYIVIKILEM